MDDNASAVSGKAAAWRQHERQWRDNRYAYAVVSRRSRGVSVGINLNPGKACNFNCIYCQVDRHEKAAIHKVDLDRLGGEIDRVLAAERDGSLYSAAPFDLLRPEERGVRDIAFSGNGEPTAFRRFGDAVRIAVDARRRFGLDQTRIVLITNAAYLKRASLQPALRLLDENNGQIWAKLDAGSEEYFRAVNRSRITLSSILENILFAALLRPLVIQSLWFRLHGEEPPREEFESFCSRLRALTQAGGQISNVQLYTVARLPAESCVSALSDPEMDRLADLLRARVTLPVETFYGA